MRTRYIHIYHMHVCMYITWSSISYLGKGDNITLFPTESLAIDFATVSVQYNHCNDVTMSPIASQITSLTAVYSTVYSDADQRKHQSSASRAFVWGIHRDRWIPRTQGQLRGKCFHFVTSSWHHLIAMKRSGHGKAFSVSGPLCMDTTGDRVIPLRRPSNVEHSCVFIVMLSSTISRVAGDLRRHNARVTSLPCCIDFDWLIYFVLLSNGIVGRHSIKTDQGPFSVFCSG